MLLSLGTGRKIDVDTLFKIARRIRNLERAYSVREGVTRELDSYPREVMDKEITYRRFDYRDKENIRLVERTAVLESKKFEEILRGSAQEHLEYFQKHKPRGEFTIAVKGKTSA